MKFTAVKLFSFFTTLLFVNQSHAAEMLRNSRKLALTPIAGYVPSTDVTDVNKLDLDQKAMEDQNKLLTATAFVNGEKIYSNGGYSESFAVLTLQAALVVPVLGGVTITGVTNAGVTITGVAYEQALTGATTLKFRYPISGGATCNVGGLTVTNTTGCLTASGTISVGVSNLAYTYSVETDNQNGRTIKGLSTKANTKMRVDENTNNAFYQDFQKFFDYYGVTDYTDKIVTAGFAGSSVTLNGKIFDFSAYDFDPRQEVIKKTTVFLGVTMFVLRQLEFALDNCAASRSDASLQALDEAVALYTGSVAGIDGNTSSLFAYNNARRRCTNYKTCGDNRDQISGNAKINIEIFAQFSLMKDNLASSKNCTAARLEKEIIAKKIFVPFIQGALRYGYLQGQPSASAKAEAEGAIFAAAVLPVIAKCNATSAATIYGEMKPNSGNTVDFVALRFAFESNYQCLGISCLDVGGLYDSANSKYFASAEPCNDTIPIIPVDPIPEEDGFFRRLLNFFRNIFSFLIPFN